MSNAQKSAFQNLLTGWRQHENLRRSGAGVDELFLSRVQLDEYRHIAATAR